MKAPKRMVEKYADIAPDRLGVSFAVLDRIEAKAAEGDQPMLISAIATTPRVDMDDEVVVSDGLDPTMFKRLCAVYFNHDYSMLPVASFRKATLVPGKGWRVQVSMSRHPFAVDVATAIQDGAIRGGSIGFRRVDWGEPTLGELDLYGPHDVITRRADWIEWSITPMPCNLDALIDGSGEKSVAIADESARALERLVTKGLIHRESAHAMGLPKPKLVTIPVRRLIPVRAS